MTTIPNFSMYRVCDSGHIWSTHWDNLKKLKPDCRLCDGRKRYTLKRDDGVYVRKYGSFFVLLATTGPRPKGLEACHFDGDCTNDSPGNLRWDTSKSNKADMKRHGTAPVGERSSTAKLNRADVLKIRQKRSSGHLLRQLAEEFQVTEANISAICSFKTWKD